MQFLDCKITLSFSNQKIKDRSETLINKGIYEVKLKFIASLITKEQEFEQLVRTHKATIYAVCYLFSKDQDEVADLFQECLINLWKSWAGYEGRSDVKTWIYRVSLNVCEVVAGTGTWV